MKVVILAGGQGTRLAEETVIRPKPMVEIGGYPIIWHIMKHYSHFDFNEFIILLGYKGDIIKEYFANYYLYRSDVTLYTATGAMECHQTKGENWKVTLVDTGLDTGTGARLKRVQRYLGTEPFMMTYGDGVADIDLRELLTYHESHKRAVTLSAVQPSGKFGTLDIGPHGEVTRFREKPEGENVWINGGFFVMEPAIFNYLNDDPQLFWERRPIEQLAEDNQIAAYRHYGFWRCMDTLRDRNQLEEMWLKNEAPWRIWPN